MSKLAKVSQDNKKLLRFLKENNERINVKELELNRTIKIRNYKKLAKKLKLQTRDDYMYFIVTVQNVIVRMLLKMKLKNIRNNLKNHYWNCVKTKMQKFRLR